MSSTKRKSSGEVESTRRVTRSATQQQQLPKPTPPTKTDERKTKKPKTKAKPKPKPTETLPPSLSPSSSHAPTIIVEHWVFPYDSKQCSRFKTRANLVQKGLEEAVPGITVLINPQKVGVLSFFRFIIHYFPKRLTIKSNYLVSAKERMFRDSTGRWTDFHQSPGNIPS
ncbi:hypothetical protein KSS87_012013 [Heliosperma pusillum]|nr:hypothetical protein KSS87_012013 [Heliosperma pusillum]